MERNDYKKQTFEDRFCRKYYCNSYRFIPKVKKINHKKFRKISKHETKELMEEYFNE